MSGNSFSGSRPMDDVLAALKSAHRKPLNVPNPYDAPNKEWDPAYDDKPTATYLDLQLLQNENAQLRALNADLVKANERLMEAAKALRLEMDALQLKVAGRSKQDLDTLSRAADFFTPTTRG